MSILTNDINKLTKVLLGDHYIIVPETDFYEYYKQWRTPDLPENYTRWFNAQWKTVNPNQILEEIKCLIKDDNEYIDHFNIANVIRNYFGSDYSLGRTINDHKITKIDVWYDAETNYGRVKIPVLAFNFCEIID